MSTEEITFDFEDETPVGPQRQSAVKITRDKAPPSPTRTTAVERDAKAAAAVLAQLNNLLCLGVMVVGFNETASVIAAGNDDFEQAAFEALVTDPVLAKKILSAGATGGKTALVVAYASLFLGAIPVGVMEYRSKRGTDDDADS